GWSSRQALTAGCSRTWSRMISKALVAISLSRSWSRPRHQVSPGGALRSPVEVLRQNPRRVRDTLEAGNAADVHDVRRPFAFDDVDAVQVDAERPTAAQGDVAQLRREREGLAVFLRFGPAGEDLLHPEQPATDRVDLAIAALRRVVALGEHGRVAVVRHLRQLGRAADDPDAVAPSSLMRLQNERSRVQQRSQLLGVRRHVGDGYWDARRLQNSEGDDLVVQRRGDRIRIHHGGAQLM